jgi:hypothetical protein
VKLRLTDLLISAIAALTVSVLGVTRGIRASAAHFLYHQARYGSEKGNVTGVMANCSTAHRLYPYNYLFAILASETAYYKSVGAEGREKSYLLSSADYWCDSGLQLNPYKSQLRMLRARLLAKDSPRDAVEYWTAYLGWHYWEPLNHCVMAEFHAMAGDFDEAFRALDVIKGMAHYEEGLQRVNDQWHKEMVMPEL